jgi:hypothetical protein
LNSYQDNRWCDVFPADFQIAIDPSANHVFDMVIDMFSSVSPGESDTFPKAEKEQNQSGGSVVIK